MLTEDAAQLNVAIGQNQENRGWGMVDSIASGVKRPLFLRF